MPSAFAHAAVGAALSTALPAHGHRLAAGCALAFLAAAPDLDVIAHQLGVAYSHPLGHRGLTHALPFAAVVAALSLPLWRQLLPGADASTLRRAALLSFAALASHGLLDAFTDAGKGIGLWIPFHDGRFFAPFRPLPTSPLSVERFFTPRGLRILQAEALWIGLPTLAALATVWGLRRLRRPKRSEHHGQARDVGDAPAAGPGR